MDQIIMTSYEKILIVDDSLVFLTAVSKLLQAKGYQVLTAVDGAAALSTVRREKIDLILLDVNFPPDVAHGGAVNWDGFRIMAWLKRMDEAKETPIIVVTSGDPAKDKARCEASAVVACFRKPVDNKELLAAIRKALDAKSGKEPSALESPGVRKILFVDDEDDWRYMATMYLTDAGYEVWTARDSAEALNQAGRARPDLIILDLNLGGESGLDVMKFLQEKHPGVPVLLYTGMDHDEAAVQAMLRDGARQYLRKTTMGEMLRAVRTAMGEIPQPKSAPEKEPVGTIVQAFAPDPESVLLLEDDATFGENLQSFLEAHSFRVTRVPDSAEGLQRIRVTDFDIILCEMQMAGLSGDRFYQAVERAKPHLCKRFVYMTEGPSDPQTEGFILRVRALVVQKPFPFTDLLTAIAIAWKRSPEASGKRSLAHTAFASV